MSKTIQVEHEGRSYTVDFAGPGGGHVVDRIQTSWEDATGRRRSRVIYQGSIAAQARNPSKLAQAVIAKAKARGLGAKAPAIQALGGVGEHFVVAGRTFRSKGLAFACARREVGAADDGYLKVERRDHRAEAIEAWVFHADGRTERAAV